VQNQSALENVARFRTPNILLDAYSAHAFGGSGKLIDLDLGAKFRLMQPDLFLVLSGGLNPGNVTEATRRVHPDAVDVASGVEREPRRKDPALIADFIRAVNLA